MTSTTCRVCLKSIKENATILSIFEEDSDSIKIYVKIMECSGIYIDENETFTNLICVECNEELKIANKFRITCQTSDKTLRENMKFKVQNDNNQTHDIETLKPEENDSTSYLQINDIKSEDEIEGNLIKDSSKIIKRKCSRARITNSYPITKKQQSRKKHDEKYPCEFCGQRYSDKTTLRYHMRRHTNEMDFICELCGTAFETNYKLVRHKMIHTGEKPYPCRYCNRPFLHSSNRNLHEKRLHTHIRNHQCEYCVKAFHTPCQLRKHIRVHTGEKPFICDLCLTGFKAKSHLTAHKNSLVPCIVKLKNKLQQSDK